MKSILFVLQSGFAIGHAYWDNFVKILSDVGDWVYLDNLACCDCNKYKLKIGIGHSLGFIKLLLAHDNAIVLDGIIGIQAFTNFCGFDITLNYVRSLYLKQMMRDYSIDPVQTIQIFHHKCGLGDVSKQMIEDIDLRKTYDDFCLLLSETKIQTSIRPTLIFSKQDPVIPGRIVVDNFGATDIDIKYIEYDQHNLGYKKCAEILSFVLRYVHSI